MYGGKRISKSDLQVEAYGSSDELSAHLGLLTVKGLGKKDKELLLTIQKDLYQVMAYLANAPVDISPLKGKVKEFERIMDFETSRLPKLTRFLLPGGTEIGVLFHIARTSTRKAERAIVALFSKQKKFKNQDLVLQYFNRLSDLFFTLSRKYSKGKEVLT